MRKPHVFQVSFSQPEHILTKVSKSVKKCHKKSRFSTWSRRGLRAPTRNPLWSRPPGPGKAARGRRYAQNSGQNSGKSGGKRGKEWKTAFRAACSSFLDEQEATFRLIPVLFYYFSEVLRDPRPWPGVGPRTLRIRH